MADDYYPEKKSFLSRIFSGLSRRLRLPLIVVIILVLASAAGGIYLVSQRPGLLGLPLGADDVEREAERLIEEVGKLIDLPVDEQPTIATVTDVEAVKDQSFFRNAENGDRVLIYTDSRRAILYRPSEKRIIEVGSVNIDEQNGGDGSSPSPSPEESPAAFSPVPNPSPTPNLAPSPSPTESPSPTPES